MLRRWLGEKPSDDMAFPHPQSRKGKNRNGDESNNGGVVGKFVERTVDITNGRNAEDDVNPAEDRTLSAFGHVQFPFPFSSNTAVSCLSIFAQPNSAPLNACSPNGRETSKPLCSRSRRVASPSLSSAKL